MKRATAFCFLFVLLAGTAVVFGSRLALAQDKGKIVHDAEFLRLWDQHRDKWSAEDKELDKKLAELPRMIWAWEHFDAMKRRHEEMIEKYPHTSTRHGEPFKGIDRIKE